ncbi:MAG: hypothetical protein JW751_17325 [Polyangiaceae bacterium]|nr:hypothetical protein [Polyangiaceae bacterium]
MQRFRWLFVAAAALGSSCHRQQLPRPELGPQGKRAPGAPCDFEAEFPAPAARIEIIDPTSQPAAGCVWVDGHYVWGAGRWTWIAGGWVRPPVGCHYAAAAAYWTSGRTEHGKLCVLYPGFFSHRDGSKCTAAPCLDRRAPAAQEERSPSRAKAN